MSQSPKQDNGGHKIGQQPQRYHAVNKTKIMDFNFDLKDVRKVAD